MGWSGLDEDWYDDDVHYLEDGSFVYFPNKDKEDVRRLLAESKPKEPVNRYSIMKPFYDKAGRVKVGDIIYCPNCRTALIKKSYQQKFCSTKCKDVFWNSAPGRVERTAKWKR